MPSTLSKLGSLTSGRSLATLRNKDGWKQWKPKARAYSSRNEIDLPLEGPEPERQTIEPTNAAANAHNAMQQAIDAGEVGVVTEPRLEADEEFESRIKGVTWKKHNKRIYNELVEACVEDALEIVQNAPFNDGRAAWLKLEATYEGYSTATTMAQLIEFVNLKQGGQDIGAFVTKWQSLVRKLKDKDITFQPPVMAVLFLEALNSKFRTYRVQRQMTGDIKLPDLYNDAIEFDRAKLGGNDEANTQGTALRASEPRKKGKCRFGKRCKNLREKGTCEWRHPPSHKEAVTAQQKQSLSEGDWVCRECDTVNFAGRTRCFGCDRPKSSGGTKRKASEMAKAAQEGGEPTLADVMKHLQEQQKELTRMKKDLATSGVAEECVRMLWERETAHAANEPVHFVVDSGASSHFVGASVTLAGTQATNTAVDTADGTCIHVRKKGKFTGTVNDTTFDFEAKQHSKFKSNLFSVKKATEDGHRVVFSAHGSYIEHADGQRVPLDEHRNGWTLALE